MAQARKSAGKFEDNIFPPDVSSLCFDPYNSKMDPDTKEMVDQVKSWKRPSEWCKNPQLLKDDASPGDIEQGQLGDCWLLSALGVVAVRPRILKHLFVKIDARRGEEGRWEEVTIDDRIPCGADGMPVFAHCVDPEEIWVPLIEKAMAKMLGTYEALDGGYLEEGVVMLTGGRPEKVTINNWKGKSSFEETSADLWHKILTYSNEGHMMGAAICSGKELPDNHTGLVAGHAYGVLNVRETSDKKFKMIELRNPWGSFEWKGKWSDGSKEWTKQYIDDLKEVDRDDGSFWMELTDFRKFFDKITVCRIFNLRLLTFNSPIATDDDKAMFGNVDWERAKFECEWNDSNAGGILNDATYGQNPHLKLTVSDKSRMFFLVSFTPPIHTRTRVHLVILDVHYISQPSLTTQADSRYYRTGIGFAIQKGSVDKKGMVKLPAQQQQQQDDNVFVQQPARNRYNSAHLMVNPGPYVIIPFTDFPNRKTKYSEKPFTASVLLPEDRAACKDVPPSARKDGASILPQRVAQMNISSSAPSAAPISSSPKAPSRVAAAEPAPRRFESVVEEQARQRPTITHAPRTDSGQRGAGREQLERATKPPKATSSPAKAASTSSPTLTKSTPPAPQRGSSAASPDIKKAVTPSPSKAKVNVPVPVPKNDRFMTTSQMFYRK